VDAVALAQQARGAKQLHQKYFMTAEDRSECEKFAE